MLIEGGSGVERTLPEMAGLSEAHYEPVVWKNPDDLADCVEALFALFRQICKEYPGAHIVANYTGGTKTMSAALVVGAVLLGWELQLNVGVRPFGGQNLFHLLDKSSALSSSVFSDSLHNGVRTSTLPFQSCGRTGR